MIDFKEINNHFEKYNPLYNKFFNYYIGNHPSYFKKFDNNKNHIELKKLIEEIKDNMCKVVIDRISDRLELLSINSNKKRANDYINDFANKHKLSSISKEIINKVLIYGDCYVLIFPNIEEEPEISIENTQDIFIKYEQRIPIYAIKIIKIKDNEETRKVWIYTQDKIYYGLSNGIPQRIEDIKDVIVFDNEYKIIPIFRFYNGPFFDTWAISELSSIIPLQDILNKEIQSRELASDLTAFRQKWVTGISIPLDQEGKPVSNLKSALDNVMTFSNPNIRIGEFQASDLANYTKVIVDIREEISRISGVPMHLIGLNSTYPSGEAMKVAEAPIIAKTNEKKALYGDVWEKIFEFILKIKDIESGTLRAVWRNINLVDEAQDLANGLTKLELGIDNAIVLKELGYNKSEEF